MVIADSSLCYVLVMYRKSLALIPPQLAFSLLLHCCISLSLSEYPHNLTVITVYLKYLSLHHPPALPAACFAV